MERTTPNLRSWTGGALVGVTLTQAIGWRGDPWPLGAELASTAAAVRLLEAAHLADAVTGATAFAGLPSAPLLALLQAVAFSVLGPSALVARSVVLLALLVGGGGLLVAAWRRGPLLSWLVVACVTALSLEGVVAVLGPAATALLLLGVGALAMRPVRSRPARAAVWVLVALLAGLELRLAGRGLTIQHTRALAARIAGEIEPGPVLVFGPSFPLLAAHGLEAGSGVVWLDGEAAITEAPTLGAACRDAAARAVVLDGEWDQAEVLHPALEAELFGYPFELGFDAQTGWQRPVHAGVPGRKVRVRRYVGARVVQPPDAHR
jgi:hypothetical protein